MTALYGWWHACVSERGEDGQMHHWNIRVDACDASDAADQAMAGYDPDRVDGLEVERLAVASPHDRNT